MCPREERRTREHLRQGFDGAATPAAAQHRVQGGGDPRVPAARRLHRGCRAGAQPEANMLRKWVIDAEHAACAPSPVVTVAPAQTPTQTPPQRGPTFVPLALPAPAVDGEIRIELQRVGTTIRIVWPAAAAQNCAARPPPTMPTSSPTSARPGSRCWCMTASHAQLRRVGAPAWTIGRRTWNRT